MPYFETESSKLHYYEYGSGEHILLAFHGFGMKGTQFKVLEEALGKKYRIYSFDLFFHGDTQLKDLSVKNIRNGLSSRHFVDQVRLFLQSKGLGAEKISLLSYSIGTRQALCLLEQLPERIRTAYFIAPDGIEPNKLLTTGGKNLLVNRLFYQLVYSPRTVTFLLNSLFKMKYIDASLYRILQAEFGTVETRLTCYNTITYYAQLSFDKQRLAQLINQHQVDCHLYFGKTDKLFPGSIGTRFARLLDKPNVHIFEEGHELVNAAMNAHLASQLKFADD